MEFPIFFVENEDYLFLKRKRVGLSCQVGFSLGRYKREDLWCFFLLLLSPLLLGNGVLEELVLVL